MARRQEEPHWARGTGHVATQVLGRGSSVEQDGDTRDRGGALGPSNQGSSLASKPVHSVHGFVLWSLHVVMG